MTRNNMLWLKWVLQAVVNLARAFRSIEIVSTCRYHVASSKMSQHIIEPVVHLAGSPRLSLFLTDHALAKTLKTGARIVGLSRYSADAMAER
jgi:hypothetical protein